MVGRNTTEYGQRPLPEIVAALGPPGRLPRGLDVAERREELQREQPLPNPDLLVFSKFKWLLKTASARTVESLWVVCGDLLDRFTEVECRNCFSHCGYRYTYPGRALALKQAKIDPVEATG